MNHPTAYLRAECSTNATADEHDSEEAVRQFEGTLYLGDARYPGHRNDAHQKEERPERVSSAPGKWEEIRTLETHYWIISNAEILKLTTEIIGI